MDDAPALTLLLRPRNLISKRRQAAPLVRCPRQGKSVDVQECTRCAWMRKVEWNSEKGGEIVCAAAAGAAMSVDRRADFAETAARRALHEVVPPTTVCIAPDTTLADVRRAFVEHGLRALPVVDDELRLLGIVSLEDVVAASEAALARDVMPSSIHALPENAPVGHAIALMAFENVNHVAVVTDEGEIVGLLNATDALRWTAEQMGYAANDSGNACAPAR